MDRQRAAADGAAHEGSTAAAQAAWGVRVIRAAQVAGRESAMLGRTKRRPGPRGRGGVLALGVGARR
jgi:hypothetical protein